MDYDFDKLTDRHQNNSYKWAVLPDELPMWVADMDFETAPAVVAALAQRLKENIFGYNTVPDLFYDSFVAWWHERHQRTIDKTGLMFCTGVVPAISAIVRKVTAPTDQVVLLTPVYNIFFNSIVNNGRQVLASEMHYQAGEYQIDFADLAEKLARPETSLLIFCNPHNPIGKVWEASTLKKIGELCVANDVLLLSDEIHCDLTHPPKKYTPFFGLAPEIDQQLIVCLAPTKAFNLAGLQTSGIYVPNQELWKKVNRGINTDEVAEPNSFAIQAAVAAFSEGGDWLDQLNHYLAKNRQFLLAALAQNCPDLTVVSSQASYLAWIDCSKVTHDAGELAAFLRKETGLILSEGAIFGGNGTQFLRWNYACPQSRLAEGIQRFITGMYRYQKK